MRQKIVCQFGTNRSMPEFVILTLNVLLNRRNFKILSNFTNIF